MIRLILPKQKITFHFTYNAKKTKNCPSISDIIKACPRKDRPLVIIWNKQINKEVNMASDGEYVMMSKEFFYKLITSQKD